MTALIYPDMIRAILRECESLILGTGSLDSLQNVVQQGEATIVAVEEKDIRSYLTSMEGDLELIRFTLNEKDHLVASQKVARQIIDFLEQRGAAEFINKSE
ncbi:hypothetical protein CHH28_07965 [Bacterioplanes sanyensis]|uniref:Uncharacterized protein n=1 Tax=Bacterioplanes sanyensis TaxID=1249553 RepID=A0A222FHT4_9GAMM|nr:hypothetical protein [Bacterioplanes sanyensis]ASP38615.1 hypothetical protein CHH28_07965 [Bacterioplanes sanyensis]